MVTLVIVVVCMLTLGVYSHYVVNIAHKYAKIVYEKDWVYEGDLITVDYVLASGDKGRFLVENKPFLSGGNGENDVRTWKSNYAVDRYINTNCTIPSTIPSRFIRTSSIVAYDILKKDIVKYKRTTTVSKSPLMFKQVKYSGFEKVE